MDNKKWLLFDWGDTLMYDNPAFEGEMYLWPEIRLMKGVNETLPVLAADYRCAVISNAFGSNALTMKRAFEIMKIDRYFELFVTSKETGCKKQDKGYFTYIIGLLKTPANNIYVIGNDYEKDIIMPKRLGMNTVLITSVRGEYPLADKVIDDFGKLKDILIPGIAINNKI